MHGYARLAAAFYDIDKPEPQPDAFDFYLEQLKQAKGPILEPMCGSGRYLLPFLSMGLEVEGVDNSAPMLAACRERAERLNVQPVLHQQSLDELHLPRQFALAFIVSGSFCLLTERPIIERTLAKLHDALLPGGRLLLEFERYQELRPELSGTWGGRWVNCPDGSKIVLSWLSQYSGRSDVTSSLHRYEHVVDGKVAAVEYEDFQVKSYTFEEAYALLEGAGFVQIEAFKPYAQVPPDDTDEAWVFSCRRVETVG
jgi:SAM-dependent methyltransferase